MSVKNTHPDYDLLLPDMDLVRDFYRGERIVKNLNTRYLTPNSSHYIDGMGSTQKGWQDFTKYLEGARFPDLVRQAVESATGIMDAENAVIEVPVRMQPLLEKITRGGDDIYSLLRKIRYEQLITGRLGLLMDVDEVTNLPYISLYKGESIRNWDEGVNDTRSVANYRVIVLDEPSVSINSQLEWETEESYRVVALQEGKYVTGVFRENFSDAFMEPVLLMGKSLDEIPFIFINTKDNLATPDLPPLLGLANKVQAIYRSEAHYRFHLYMQSQDTLVRIGFIGDKENPVRTGAGSIIDVDPGGDVKYVGVNSQGLPEERVALENDYRQAEEMAMKILDKQSAESNEALMTRRSSQTASMTQIAKTAAFGVEQILRIMAEWMQLNPEEVTVTAFTDFTEVSITGRDVIDLRTAKQMGAAISNETIHNLMREGGITDKTYEDELIAIAKEDDTLGRDMNPPPDENEALPGKAA